MRKRTQEERILDMIKRPVPRKRVGIVHLEIGPGKQDPLWNETVPESQGSGGDGTSLM